MSHGFRVISYGFLIKASKDVPLELIEQFNIPTKPVLIHRGSNSREDVTRYFLENIVDVGRKIEEFLKYKCRSSDCWTHTSMKYMHRTRIHCRYYDIIIIITARSNTSKWTAKLPIKTRICRKTWLYSEGFTAVVWMRVNQIIATWRYGLSFVEWGGYC